MGESEVRHIRCIRRCGRTAECLCGPRGGGAGVPREDRGGRHASRRARDAAPPLGERGDGHQVRRHVRPHPEEQRAHEVRDGLRHRAALRLYARQGVRLRNRASFLGSAVGRLSHAQHRRRSRARRDRRHHRPERDALGCRHAHALELGHIEGAAWHQQPGDDDQVVLAQVFALQDHAGGGGRRGVARRAFGALARRHLLRPGGRPLLPASAERRHPACRRTGPCDHVPDDHQSCGELLREAASRRRDYVQLQRLRREALWRGAEIRRL